MSGHVDKAILERMAKIMSYMRVSTGKPGKKPKKKDKLAALHGMGHSQGTNFPVVHGTENIIPKAAGMYCLLGCACQSQEGQRHMVIVAASISMHMSCPTTGCSPVGHGGALVLGPNADVCQRQLWSIRSDGFVTFACSMRHVHIDLQRWAELHTNADEQFLCAL